MGIQSASAHSSVPARPLGMEASSRARGGARSRARAVAASVLVGLVLWRPLPVGARCGLGRRSILSCGSASVSVFLPGGDRGPLIPRGAPGAAARKGKKPLWPTVWPYRGPPAAGPNGRGPPRTRHRGGLVLVATVAARALGDRARDRARPPPRRPCPPASAIFPVHRRRLSMPCGRSFSFISHSAKSTLTLEHGLAYHGFRLAPPPSHRRK